jgi:hypothetical protein
VKYGNRITEIDGYKFASRKEAARYAQLKVLAHIGQIRDLEVHPRFVLEANGQPLISPSGRKIHYVADFSYTENDVRHIEDVKGWVDTGSPVYRLFSLKVAIVASMTGVIVEVI